MIVNANCLDHLKTLPDNIVDCLVTDPPYGIEFMGKDWDKSIPDLEIWKECLRVMKPGAFGFVFSIPRQDCLSRMMISLEQAGFNINFSSIYWTYASGFPKALHIGKAIDKRAGVKGKEVIRQDFYDRSNKKECEMKQVPCGTKGVYNLPATPEAKKLEGSYGGFQPKPAVEVIIVVMKPLSKNSYIDQALDNGKGVTWLDDCRIPYKDENDEDSIQNKGKNINLIGMQDRSGKGVVYEPSSVGRFPANLIVEDEVLDDGKISKSSKGFDPGSRNGTIFGCGRFDNSNTYSDSGSFSRYFSLDAWAEKNLPFLIVPKASKSEKNRGCEKLKQENVMFKEYWANFCRICSKRGDVCKCENPEYEKKNIDVLPNSNNHPTVKPIKVMSYLITMGSREGDVILDPFAGSGTTGCAAVLLRRNYILIELDKEYVEIIKARVKHYTEKMKNEPLKI